MAITPSQLSAALTAAGLPGPSLHFLATVLSSSSSNSHSSHPRTQPPLPALAATAKHRLLSSDIASSSPALLAPDTASFPPHISAAQVRERRLAPAPAAPAIPVQVLAVEDLSRSRWEQLEAMEAQERGEMTRGREIVRVADTEGPEDGGGEGGRARALAAASASAGPHRLLLQDVKGQTVYGLELKAVKGVGMDMSIGTKMMLSGVVVARGVLLLQPETAVVLGGKIDALHKAWMENRKKDLLAALEGRA